MAAARSDSLTRNRFALRAFAIAGELKFWIGQEEGQVVHVKPGEVLHILPHVPQNAEAIEDTLDVDIFDPPREDCLKQTGYSPKYAHGHIVRCSVHCPSTGTEACRCAAGEQIITTDKESWRDLDFGEYGDLHLKR